MVWYVVLRKKLDGVMTTVANDKAEESSEEVFREGWLRVSLHSGSVSRYGSFLLLNFHRMFDTLVQVATVCLIAINSLYQQYLLHCHCLSVNYRHFI